MKFFNLLIALTVLSVNYAAAQLQLGKKTADLDASYVSNYLETEPSIGVAYSFGKTEYLGQLNLADHEVAKMQLKSENFKDLTDYFTKEIKAIDGFENAKFLETDLDQNVPDGDKEKLLAYMDQHELDLLYIIGIGSFMSETESGKKDKLTYTLDINSHFYFKGCISGNDKPLKACRATQHLSGYLSNIGDPIYQVMNWGTFDYDRIQRNLSAFAVLNQTLRENVTSMKENIKKPADPEYYGIVLGMQDNLVKISVRGWKSNSKLLGTLTVKKYSVVDKVKGDNPATFWREDDYDIIVANLKAEEQDETSSVCEIIEMSNGITVADLKGLPVVMTGSFTPAYGGNTPDIKFPNNLIGKRFTPEEYKEYELTAASGNAGIDKSYYTDKEILHPPTTLNTSATPNIIPKKEKTLLAKVRRFESEGNKIAIAYQPGFVLLKDPSKTQEDQTATTNQQAGMTSYSTPTIDCAFEAGAKPLSDNYLYLGKELEQTFNEAFETDIFEVVDVDKIPQKEEKAFGVSSMVADYFNTQYKIVVNYTISGEYKVHNAGSNTIMIKDTEENKEAKEGKYDAFLELISEVQIIELNDEKGKTKNIALKRFIHISDRFLTGECPTNIDDLESIVGTSADLYDDYLAVKEKNVDNIIKKELK
ncbi:hypothetical protein ACFLU5_14860 [Bacteroidota bacterium]